MYFNPEFADDLKLQHYSFCWALYTKICTTTKVNGLCLFGQTEKDLESLKPSEVHLRSLIMFAMDKIGNKKEKSRVEETFSRLTTDSHVL